MGVDVLDLPPLAGDWRGQVGLEVDSRWRGRGKLLVSGYDARAVELLVRWRLLQVGQVDGLLGVRGRGRRVLGRLHRMGLADRVTVAGVTGYTVSGYVARQLGVTVRSWSPLRALRVLAGNRLGEVLVRAAGGQWQVEPDAVLAGLWAAGGETYGVYVYRYWPGAEREAALVLGAVPGRMLVVAPRRADAEQLARAGYARAPEQVRWTWDMAIVAGRAVQFWRQQGEGLAEAERIALGGGG